MERVRKSNKIRTVIKRSLKPFSTEKYDSMIGLLQGTFHVPKKQRTKEQRSAVVKYRRSKNEFSVENNILMHMGKPIMKKADVRNAVEKEFQKAQGCGARALTYKLRSKKSAISESVVSQVLQKSKQYHQANPHFLNAPPPKTVTATEVADRWQIDLMEMRKDAVQFHGVCYKYILSIIDVYSRYTILRPLKRKTASEVASELSNVFLEHGIPRMIQCDNGSEFKGRVTQLLKRHGIKIINSRPYHPQSQGKCERLHRTLRQKMRFSSRRKYGYNWVDSLPKLASAMNNTPKRVLGYITPFQAYHGRPHSRVHTKKGEKTQQTTRLAVEHGTESYKKSIMKNKKQPSTYNVGERVLVRFPFSGSRIPRKRYVLRAKILDRKLDHHRYRITFVGIDGQRKDMWTGVENITSLTYAKEKERRNKAESRLQKQQHRSKYCILQDKNSSHDAFDIFDDGSIKTIMNPAGDGNCQFSAIAHQFSNIGILRKQQALRETAATHLEENRIAYAGFIEGEFQNYINNMRRDRTYGDHTTLMAIMREFNCQCVLISVQGQDHACILSNDGVYHNDIPTIALGYFPENRGEHYTSLQIKHIALRRIIDVLNNRNKQMHMENGQEEQQQSIHSSRTSKHLRDTAQLDAQVDYLQGTEDSIQDSGTAKPVRDTATLDVQADCLQGAEDSIQDSGTAKPVRDTAQLDVQADYLQGTEDSIQDSGTAKPVRDTAQPDAQADYLQGEEDSIQDSGTAKPVRDTAQPDAQADYLQGAEDSIQDSGTAKPIRDTAQLDAQADCLQGAEDSIQDSGTAKPVRDTAQLDAQADYLQGEEDSIQDSGTAKPVRDTAQLDAQADYLQGEEDSIQDSGTAKPVRDTAQPDAQADYLQGAEDSIQDSGTAKPIRDTAQLDAQADCLQGAEDSIQDSGTAKPVRDTAQLDAQADYLQGEEDSIQDSGTAKPVRDTAQLDAQADYLQGEEDSIQDSGTAKPVRDTAQLDAQADYLQGEEDSIQDSGTAKPVRGTAQLDVQADNELTDGQYLPNEILILIIKLCLQSEPTSRFVLRRVNSFFRNIVAETPFDIYLPNLGTYINDIPQPVSVRRLIRNYGRNSGVAVEIKRLLTDPRWYNAWLYLRERGLGWYSIDNLLWRRPR